MEELKIKTGIKEIAVKNEKDEVTAVLRINMTDAAVADRFANLIRNMNGLSDEYRKDTQALDAKYADSPIGKDNVDMEQIIERSGVNISYLNRCADEIDAVFGEGTVRAVFSECYAINPDYVPDENALTDFVESIIPVMNSLFEQRFEENRKRYSAARRGKNTRNV